MNTREETFQPAYQNSSIQNEPAYRSQEEKSTPVSKTTFRFEVESDRILSLAEIERAYLEKVTKETKCSKERMAELLGINRKTLYRKQKEYRL